VKTKNKLYEVLVLFLKLGTIGFGGPLANIALMEQEAVHKRKWVDQQDFLDMLAITNLIPGPNAVEMALHLGYAYAGNAGLWVAGSAFILPSFLMILGLSILYADYGSIPQVEAIFYAINPLLISIIINSAFHMGKEVLKDWKAIVVFAVFLLAAILGLNETLVIILAGAVWVLVKLPKKHNLKLNLLYFLPILPEGVANQHTSVPFIFLYFLKTGSVLFGSGLALLALIQNDVVNKFHWLTQQQLIDAITIGQVTPGPVSSTATFIGYQVAGIPGAVAATVGIFLPSFLIVLLIMKWIPNIKRGGVFHDFLQGVTIGVLALILVVAYRIFQSAITDIFTAIIAVTGLFLLWRYKVETIYLVLAGIAISLIKFYVF
jgi:chromate transporter